MKKSPFEKLEKARTLEQTISAMLELAEFPEGSRFDVVGFELTHDGEGWSVNQPFTMRADVEADEIPAIARGRWEIFKQNYMPRARVKDIAFLDSGSETDCEIECGGLAFITIRKRETSPAGWDKVETSVED